MKPSLLILAAGLGRRYGALKQVQPVGPNGETIIDYTVFDALRAGFGKVVFVVRNETVGEFRSLIGSRLERVIPVEYAPQAVGALPPGVLSPPSRTKPWGTGHAVLAAANLIHEPFAVANADDLYGAGAINILASFLQTAPAASVPVYASIGYRLRDTLPETGTVSRAVCHNDAEGWLKNIEEITGIQRHGQDGQYTDKSGHVRTINGECLVSMNLWGLAPSVFRLLGEEFERFLGEHASSDDAEFQLPSAMGVIVRAGAVRFQMLPSTSAWCGMTHRQDREATATRIRELIEHGEYPAELWA